MHKDSITETLYIARHGQTEWNAAHRIQGHYDPPLSREGYRQRRALFYAFKDKPLARIYTSALGRTILTAQPLSTHLGVELHSTSDLNELAFGLIEGEDYTDLDDWGLETWNWWLDDPVHRRMPGGGESYSDVLARANAFLTHLRQQQIQGPILIVAHFRINQMLLGCLTDTPIERAIAIRQKNHWLYQFNPESGISHAEVTTQTTHTLQWQGGLLFSTYGCGPRPGPPKQGDIV